MESDRVVGLGAGRRMAVGLRARADSVPSLFPPILLTLGRRSMNRFYVSLNPPVAQFSLTSISLTTSVRRL